MKLLKLSEDEEIRACVWYPTELLFAGSISPQLLRHASRSGMPVEKLLKIIIPVSGSTYGTFWHHLHVYDSHLGAIGEVLTARMQAGHYGFEKLLALAANPYSRKYDFHHKDCHDCRSEVGWLVSQLPNYAEYGSIKP